MTTHILRVTQPAFYDLPRGLAVATRFTGATATRGSRVIATCRRDSDSTFQATVEYDHAGGTEESHYKAALACLAKIEAENEWLSFRLQAIGSTVDGYVFVTEAVARM